MDKIILVTLEGNIAAGKTTLIKDTSEYIEKFMSFSGPNEINVAFFEEQIPADFEKWCAGIQDNAYNFKGSMLRGQKTVTELTQLKFLETTIERYEKVNNKIEEWVKNDKKGIIFMDRGLAGWFAFVHALLPELGEELLDMKDLYESEKDNKFKKQLMRLKEMHSINHKLLVRACFYLNTDEQTCLRRIKKRKRSGEDIYNSAYLQDIYKAHFYIYSRLSHPKWFHYDILKFKFVDSGELIVNIFDLLKKTFINIFV